MKNKTAYQKAGVDIVKADRFTSIISSLVKKTMNKNVYKSIGGYAGLYKIDDHRYIAATTDGVGTKLKIAFETGVHDSVGIDLVAMSVNDLICVGAQPLFFLDYLATGKLELATSTKILKGIVKGCVQGKVALIGGETAEMPDLYKKGEYDLAGFAVGILDKKQILDGTRVQAGDVLIGIESSGPHSNGFSLIRKLIKKNEKQLLKRVFQPTKIYVRAIEDLNKKLGKSVSGMAHITGSGFLNVPRISEKFDYYFKIPEKLKCQKIFHELRTRAKMDLKEAYETFNMGFGMVVAVRESHAKLAVQCLKNNNEKAQIIGEVRKSTLKGANVFIHTQGMKLHLK